MPITVTTTAEEIAKDVFDNPGNWDETKLANAIHEMVHLSKLK